MFNFAGSGITTFTANNLIFQNGLAQGQDDATSSGLGGAIATPNILTMDGGAYTFTNNQALGGDAVGGNSSMSGWGGAISSGTLTMPGGTYTFTGNTAQGGGAVGDSSNSSNSGWGGAILVTADLAMTGGTYTFTNNQALGGNALGVGSDNSYSGQGGAIYTRNNLTMTGGAYTFIGNTAQGGTAVGDSSDSYYSGRGGAIFAYYDLTMAGGTYTFAGNQALGGNALGVGSDSSESGRGGAIYANANGGTNYMTMGTGAYTFIDNTAQGGNAVGDSSGSSYSGQGGAIFAYYDLTMTGGTYTFTNNQALGGDALGNTSNSYYSGRGGAIYVDDVLTMTDGTYTFTNNQALGGDAVGVDSDSYSSGQGGAIYTENYLTMTGGTYTFAGNQARGGDAVGEGSSSGASGSAGAIYVDEYLTMDGGAYTFTGNIAQGGNALGANSSSASSGQGGALWVKNDLAMTGGTYTFTGNQALGGKATGTGADSDVSGLGGAIFTTAEVTLSGSAWFMNNLAATANPNDPSSGRGGAVFVDALDQNVAFAPSTGNYIAFRDNAQRNAAGTLTPNSLYFGNLSVAGNDKNIYFDLNPEADAFVILWDPMASQPAGLVGASGQPYADITHLAITQNGPGTFALNGVNHLPGQANFLMLDGTFNLMQDAQFILDAPGSRVNLENGIFMPTITPRGASLISAPFIELGDSAPPTLKLQPSGIASLTPGTAYSARFLQATTLLTDKPNGVELLDNERLKVGYHVDGNNAYLDVTTKTRPTGLGFSDNAVNGLMGSGAYLGNFDVYWPVDNWYYTGNLGMSDGQVDDTNMLAGDFVSSTPLVGKMAYANFGGLLRGHFGQWLRLNHAAALAGADAGTDAGEVPAPGSGEDPAPGAGGYLDARGFDPTTPNRIWAMGARDWADLSSDGDQVGFDADIFGAALGYDFVLTENWLAGLALGFSNTDTTSKNGGRATMDSDTWFISLYGAFNYDAWQVDASLSYGQSDNSTRTRYPAFGVRTEGDFDAEHYGANLNIGYEIDLTENLWLTPFVGLNYYHGEQDSYTEDQAGFTKTLSPWARHISGGDYDSLQIPVGVRLSGLWQLTDAASLAPELSIAYAHEFMDEGGEITARLIDGRDSWTADGIEPGREALLLNAAINLNINQNVEIGAGYSLELRDQYTDNQVRLNLGVKF